MQKKFVFKKRSSTEDAKAEKTTLVYTPSDMDEKDIMITVKDADLADQLGLPIGNFGDSVIVEFGATEKQSKLLMNEKEDEDPKTEGEDNDKQA